MFCIYNKKLILSYRSEYLQTNSLFKSMYSVRDPKILKSFYKIAINDIKANFCQPLLKMRKTEERASQLRQICMNYPAKSAHIHIQSNNPRV